MKKVLLTLLAAIVVLGALAGAGYAGYRIGFAQGAISSGNAPFIGRSERMSPGYMPMMPNFDRDFGLRVQPYRTPTMGWDVFGFGWLRNRSETHARIPPPSNAPHRKSSPGTKRFS